MRVEPITVVAEVSTRYGVIVGLSGNATHEQAAQVVFDLERRFPGVAFAAIADAQSIAFPLPELRPA